ncbi:hypothetical protein ALC57_03911 [Trachymyrmex cornetzi]|uniref:Uncharacterized protein n=1 Tax=Trachymyrmex cornetzi TaxID=471704 RepID=A0A151JLM4_9HYME|nr:hypothetical protein ALC57_03911 [Trachymyrmex cornetzi]
MEYIMGHQRSVPQLAPCKITESVMISVMDASEYDTDLEEKFVPSPEIRAPNETLHIDFEERFWYTAFGLIKEQCYESMKSENKIQYSCRQIKIPVGGEMCIELMITDNLVMPYYDCEENPAQKVYRDLCDKYMRNQSCHPCREYELVDEHNTTRVQRDLKIVKKIWKITSEWNANCWSSATGSLLWWSILRGCNDATNGEEFCRAKRPHFAVGHRQSAVARIARLAGAKSQLERRFVHVGGEYTNAGNVVLERVRDAVERHDSVKVNTAFNGEFATKDKRANKSIITKNSEICRCTDIREWYERHVVEPILTSLK